MFRGNKKIDAGAKDSAFILVMTLAVLLGLSALFSAVACLIQMKSKLIEKKSASFYEALESESLMIQSEWKNEID
ncbi:hypothetical protein [Treponema zioleckii]|uniref:hypothetical protein n=1 Tax=Treponema zioleckii TaxID=331680 RepID=UPI00168A8411|nr:hypothetical protein [Treponema zioleckii]